MTVATQSDGKILVGGGNSIFALERYNANGTIDNSFGQSGVVQTSIGAANTWVCGLALQGDGKIVAVGYAEVQVGKKAFDNAFVVARYNSNGSLDPTFGGTGIVTTPVGPYFASVGAALSLAEQVLRRHVSHDASGNIVVAGTVNSSAASSGSAGNVTLTASNILNSNPTTTISQVNFYLQNPDLSLTLVGTGTNNNGTWSLTFAESTFGLTAGNNYTFVAQAIDSNGLLSDPVTLVLTVM
jgi:uncharacterized delta-60 repeat protein